MKYIWTSLYRFTEHLRKTLTYAKPLLTQNLYLRTHLSLENKISTVIEYIRTLQLKYFLFISVNNLFIWNEAEEKK